MEGALDETRRACGGALRCEVSGVAWPRRDPSSAHVTAFSGEIRYGPALPPDGPVILRCKKEGESIMYVGGAPTAADARLAMPMPVISRSRSKS